MHGPSSLGGCRVVGHVVSATMVRMAQIGLWALRTGGYTGLRLMLSAGVLHHVAVGGVRRSGLLVRCGRNPEPLIHR
ncbi:hypothetical protein [Azospirillum largimobile]